MLYAFLYFALKLKKKKIQKIKRNYKTKKENDAKYPVVSDRAGGIIGSIMSSIMGSVRDKCTYDEHKPASLSLPATLLTCFEFLPASRMMVMSATGSAPW